MQKNIAQIRIHKRRLICLQILTFRNFIKLKKRQDVLILKKHWTLKKNGDVKNLLPKLKIDFGYNLSSSVQYIRIKLDFH